MYIAIGPTGGGASCWCCSDRSRQRIRNERDVETALGPMSAPPRAAAWCVQAGRRSKRRGVGAGLRDGTLLNFDGTLVRAPRELRTSVSNVVGIKD